MSGLVESYATGLVTLRHQVVLSGPGKHVRVRQVEGLTQDNLLVLPLPPVPTGGQTDFPALSAGMHHLEKHIPVFSPPQEKRVSHKQCGDIRDAAGGKHGVLYLRQSRQMVWRGPAIHTNGPLLI